MEESHGHDINSGAGLVIICPSTRRMLLGLRSESEERDGGKWCTFGGLMQNKETPLEAALREVMEEAEIKPTKTIKQAVFVDPTGEGENDGFVFYTFIGTVDEECCPTINHEHEDHNWYRFSELAKLNLHPGIKRLINDESGVERIKEILTS